VSDFNAQLFISIFWFSRVGILIITLVQLFPKLLQGSRSSRSDPAERDPGDAGDLVVGAGIVDE
jgi:hypothetical protein